MKLFDRFTLQQKKKAEKKEKKPREASDAESGSAMPPKPIREDEAGLTAYVLRAPHITEKAAFLGGYNQHVFRVAEHATKNDIARAFRALYGFAPESVNTVLIPRKRRRLGRSLGFKAGYKKAIITLPEGKTIEVMPK